MGPKVPLVWIFPHGAAHASVDPRNRLCDGIADRPIWLEFAKQPSPILNNVVARVQNGSQNCRTLHQYPACLILVHIPGLIVVAALEVEREPSFLLAKPDLHVLSRDSFDACLGRGLRIAFWRQPSKVDNPSEAIGGHNPAEVFYHWYPIPLSPLSTAYCELSPR